MARLYGANTTDRVTFTQGGGFTGLDNLANTVNGFTVIHIGRRTADLGNLYSSGKNPSGASTTAGWEFLLSAYDGVAVNGHLRFIVWSASGTAARWDILGGNAAGSNINVLNQHEIMAASWSGNVSKTVKLYRSAIETPVSEVTSYHTLTGTTGTGAPANDAGGNLVGWNNPRGTILPWTGDGAWIIIFNRVLSIAELRTVQAGILVHRAGTEAANAATQTRGANIIKSVAGYVMVNYQDNAGVCTEYSGNNITAANTNAVVAGAESSNWFAPTVFEDDAETTLAEQTLYRYTSDNARVTYQTAATSFSAWWYGTLDPATYPNQAVLGYDIGGVPTDKLSTTTINAHNAATVSGLSAGAKTIRLQNGVRSHPAGVPAPFQGSFLLAVQFNAAATETAPPARSRQCVVMGDSVFAEGFLSDWPQKFAPSQVIRRALPSWLDCVLSWSAGGQEFRDYCVDVTARNDAISRLPTTTRAILLALGANDKIRNNWTTATASPNIVAWLNAMLVRAPNAKIWILSTPPLTDVTANGLGQTHANWRAFEATLPALTATPSRVVFVDTSGWYAAGVTLDGSHPPTATYTGIITPNIQALLAADPFPSAGGGKHRRMTIGHGIGI